LIAFDAAPKRKLIWSSLSSDTSTEQIDIEVDVAGGRSGGLKLETACRRRNHEGLVAVTPDSTSIPCHLVHAYWRAQRGRYVFAFRA
jgi:hypothetical protein